MTPSIPMFGQKTKILTKTDDDTENASCISAWETTLTNDFNIFPVISTFTYSQSNFFSQKNRGRGELWLWLIGDEAGRTVLHACAVTLKNFINICEMFFRPLCAKNRNHNIKESMIASAPSLFFTAKQGLLLSDCLNNLMDFKNWKIGCDIVFLNNK
jgi:hypothetical protein